MTTSGLSREQKRIGNGFSANATDFSNRTHQSDREVSSPQNASIVNLNYSFESISVRPPGIAALQRKLAVGPVNDAYEREADLVARQVSSRVSTAATAGQPLQRMGEEEDDNVLQAKRLADSIQRQDEFDEEDDLLQGKRVGGSVQRMGVDDQEEFLQPMSLLQRQSDGAMDASPELEQSIRRARGGGQALDGRVRGSMENAFGADFSRVKIHTDSRADQLNRSIQARAFTTGQDIFMRQGEYTPGSRSGQELLAHELTHVVQQNKGVRG